MTSHFARLVWACTTLAALCTVGVLNAPSASADRHSAASAAPSPSLESYTVSSSHKAVSSRHVHLQLDLRAEYDNFGTMPDVARAEPVQPDFVDVGLSTPSDTELHNWEFDVPRKMFTMRPSKGTGSLNTHAKIHPFGSVRFTFKPAGKVHSRMLCPEETMTHQALRVTEHVTFNTRSKGKRRWGSVNGTFHAKGSVDATYGNPLNGDPSCADPKQRCVPGTTADAFAGNPPADESDDLNVSPSANGDTIVAMRGIALNAPEGADRSDQLTVPAKPFSVHDDGKTFTANVAAKGSPITGTGTFSASAEVTSPDSECKGTFTETTYQNPTFTNGPQPLRFHEAIEGAFGIKDNHLENVELTSIQQDTG